jgi:hypothetical protein
LNSGVTEKIRGEILKFPESNENGYTIYHKLGYCGNKSEVKCNNNSLPQNNRDTELGVVVHTYNSSYSGGTDKRIIV